MLQFLFPAKEGFVRNTLLTSLAALGACAVLTGPAVQSQTLPDISTSLRAPGTPRPNGQIYASFTYRGTITVTADAVAYRGSVAAGGASEILRQTLTFGPGSYPVMDSGATIPFNEGDIFTVCINPSHNVAESNYNNNCQEGVVSSSATDLAIGVADISMTPVGASAGQPVTVTAKVRNKSNVAARTLVRLFQSHPDSPNSRLLGQNTINVPPSGYAVASFTVVRPPGDSNFWVQLEDVYPRESTTSDNLTSRNVYLKSIINTGRTSPGGGLPVPYVSSPSVGDLLGTGQPVMVFAEYAGVLTNNAEARITAMQLFNDGTYRELWSKSGFLQPAADALAPALADIDGDGQPEVIFEAVHRNPDSSGGQVGIFVLNRDGSLKWQHIWNMVGRVPCHNSYSTSKPTLGDMNGDGVVDITVLEAELVVLDGRNGNELLRKPGVKSGTNPVCVSNMFSAIADLDGDGKNEYIASGEYGTHVFNNNGTLRWEANLWGSAFALVDADKDGKPELMVPQHRGAFQIVDASTGQLKKSNKPSPNWGGFGAAAAATTSIDANGNPNFAIANNDNYNGTGLLDNNLNLKWYTLVPPMQQGLGDNPSYVVLADLLGQGRPQVISHSNYRNLGIQDITTGQWLEYFSITGGFYGYDSWPIPVDADGDGHGEIIVNYSLPWTYDGSYEPRYPPADFLVFGSDQWKKIPSTWNQFFFVPNQVDQKLAFKHDYQPWKTHNTWMQQPLRKPCDVDFDDDVDQNDISAITAARGQTVPAGDWRDYNKDGLITIDDARACTQRCTLGNCAQINPTGHILSVTPRQVFPGSTANVTIRAEFLKFQPGKVTVNFGPGVTVSNLKVIDSDTLTATVTIAAGQSGDRDVTITSSGIMVSRPSAFSLSAGNSPPTVRATTPPMIVLPGNATLTGTVTDDGLPYHQLSYAWQFVAGPGQVTFSSPTSLSTSVSFSREGFYVLRLSASDGQYYANCDIGVVVVQGNQAPYVSAGPPITVSQDTVTITLRGTVQDDGLPYGGLVTSQWAKVGGPGTVTFGAPNAAVTNVAFAVPGTYLLSLSASDGSLSSSSTVAVTVNPPAPRILSVSPASGVPGQTQTVTIVTRYMTLVAGGTQVSFGAGTSVGGGAAGGPGPVTVIDATTATAQVSIAGGAALGPRTVTVATGTEQASKESAFTVGTIGVPYSVLPNLNYSAIAPGDSIVANPQVVDAAGNVIAGTAGFTMTVTPKPGLMTGNAPIVSGLTATFPALQKRLINQNPDLDPTGKYADGDPTDPNYGKETGGIYTVEVKLNGTAVKGAVDVVVLPSGTAEISLRVLHEATELDSILEAAGLAAASGNPTAISSSKGALAAITAKVEYNPKVLSANNVMFPPNGFLPTYPQMAGRFAPMPDDASFGRSIISIISQVRLIRARIDAITGTTLSQADIDALTAGSTTYKSMIDQFGALKPGPLGVTMAGGQLDALLSTELPMLLDSMTRKSTELLTAVAAASPGFTPKSPAMSVASNASDYELLRDFVKKAVAIFRNMNQYAKENIVELVASLANDLLNIAISNLINSVAPGDVVIDYVMSGSDFSFACPDYPNTYVEGEGFNDDVKMNKVAVIGCINSEALRDLLSLKRPKDPKSAQKLFDDIKKIAEALGIDKIVADPEPDLMREGLFGGNQLVFYPGWPRVNQGRLPCVGIVIVYNKGEGSFHSVNMNMLASCN